MRDRLGAGQGGLQVGDTRVAFGEFGAEAAEGVVHVAHAVAAGGEREAEGLDIGAVDRALEREGVLEPLRGGLGQGACLAAAHHGERHRGDHDGERDDEEQEHNHR